MGWLQEKLPSDFPSAGLAPAEAGADLFGPAIWNEKELTDSMQTHEVDRLAGVGIIDLRASRRLGAGM